MNFESNIKSLNFCETVFESATEQSVECEFNLPDYCPEIKRIIKCCLTANLTSVQRLEGKINAQVNACVRVIYIGENNKVSAYEQTQPVQKTFESDKVKGESVVSVRVNTDYVNCRATSPRRVDIKAMLTFVFKMISKGDERILTSASECGIQTLEKDYSYCDLKALAEKSFNLTEVAEIASDKPSVGRILDSSAYISVTDSKIINNKMLLKGECFIRICYLSDGEFSVELAEHSIPVSQIVEIDGITDNCETNLDVGVTACEVITKIDSTGESRLFDLNIRASATVTAFENSEVTLISDLYSTKFKADNSVKYINIMSANTNFSNTFTNKVTLESIGVSVDKVCAAWCDGLKYNYSHKNGKCVIQGNYQANVMYSDSEKQIGMIQKSVDFEYPVDLKENAESIVCYPSLQIGACSCSTSGESRLELRTELFVSGKILSLQNVKCIESARLSENVERAEKSALTIYFSDSKERVWDIAKRYNTSVQAVMEENELDSDVVENKRILLIPSV